MPSPIAQHGITLDNTFDPYVAGTTKAAATGISENGVDICNLYANIIYGTAAAATGIRCRAALTELNAIFAKKGTASYNLPIEDTVYQATQNGVNGSAQLIFNMLSNGTYTIVRSLRGVLSTLATGTWLPAGDSVGNYTCKFTGAQTVNSLAGDASFNNATNAPTAQALTTSRSYTADASVFTELGAIADQSVAVTMSYYRLGVLVHDVHVTFGTKSTS
jgi:hypothetical protein